MIAAFSVVRRNPRLCYMPQGRFTGGLGESVNRKRSFMNILRHIEVGVRRVGIKKDSIWFELIKGEWDGCIQTTETRHSISFRTSSETRLFACIAGSLKFSQLKR